MKESERFFRAVADVSRRSLMDTASHGNGKRAFFHKLHKSTSKGTYSSCWAGLALFFFSVNVSLPAAVDLNESISQAAATLSDAPDVSTLHELMGNDFF